MTARTDDSFEERLATLDLGETMDVAATATLVPSDLSAFTDPVERLRTLPQMVVGIPPRSRPENVDLDMLSTLGEGGMGLVRLAMQTALDRAVAVKTLRESSKSESGAPKLLQEAFVTGRLEHPNIIPVYTLGRDEDGLPLIVMKRIEGVAWLDILDDPSRAPEGSEPDLHWHLDVLLQVCNALRFAHSHGIIHRDIKPENVMIGTFGEVYLLDWGIAVSIDDNPSSTVLPHRSQAKGLAGTPAYMAPEMTDNDASAQDVRTDVFLLGATLHHIVTGEPPNDGAVFFDVLRAAFDAEPKEYPSEVPEGLVAIMRKAMAKEPAERYASVTEFRDAVESFLIHRSSLELSETARDILEEIRRLRSENESDAVVIHDLFTECRFATRQALKEWPQNPLAADVRAEATREQIEFALHGRDLTTARVAYGELGQADPELAARIARLEAELEDERADHERLRRFEKNLDISRGRVPRSVFVILLGVLFAATAFFAHYTQHDPTAGPYSPIPGTIRIVVIAVGALILFRKRIFRNLANRQVAYILMILVATIVPLRLLMAHFETPPVAIHAIECCVYFLTSAATAVLVDLRILWVAPLYLLIGTAAIWSPETRSLLLGVGHLAAFGWVAYLWTPKQLEKRIAG